MNGRLTEGAKCCLKGCEKLCWHSKIIFFKKIRIKRQLKEFTYLHFCWIVIPQQLARWMWRLLLLYHQALVKGGVPAKSRPAVHQPHLPGR